MRAFENRSGADADAYLAAAIADELTTTLIRTRRVLLVAAPETRTARPAADFAVAGAVRRVGDALWVTARVERVATGRIAWTASFRRTARDLAAVAESVTAGTVRALGLVPPRRTRQATDPAVYDLFVRGRYLMYRRTPPSMARAVALFREAIATDSSSPLGWIGLARALERANRWAFTVPGIPRESIVTAELAAAERATELDSLSPDVWLMRGRVSEDVDPTSRAAALRSFRRALALDSLDAEAWGVLGLALEETGEGEGAVAAWRRSLSLDASNAQAMSMLALHYFWRRDYESAAVWADSAVATDPTLLLAHTVAADVALPRRRLEEAEAHALASRRLSTAEIHATAVLALVALARGDTSRSRALLAAAEAATDTAAPALHAVPDLAALNAALGDHDRAIRWLTRYHPLGDLHFQLHLRYEPDLDPLRSDPRFQALLTH